jgi:homoserine dehydrogenase
MNKKVEVAIIGAGSAGLSALRQVKEHTDRYVSQMTSALYVHKTDRRRALKQ